MERLIENVKTLWNDPTSVGAILLIVLLIAISVGISTLQYFQLKRRRK